MVSPITGPFSRSILYAGATPNWGLKTQTWYRQKRPFTEVLAYDMQLRRVISRNSLVGGTSTYLDSPGGNNNDVFDARNKAYNKLSGSLGEAQQWAVNIAEAGKSVDMIANRAGTLLKAARLVARGRWVAAAQTMGTFVPRHYNVAAGKSVSKGFAKDWLEFHFGWEPLVKDISNAVELVTNPFMTLTRCKGSAKIRSSDTVTGGSGTSTWKRFTRYQTTYREQAMVKILDSNSTLLQQLGFTNAYSIVWELVPFSFVVDWFGNVGQVLGSFTDFYGMSVLHPCSSVLQQADRQESWIAHGGTFDGQEIIRIQSDFIWHSRTPSIQGPVLKLKPFHGFSVTRGATAIALLTQFLKSH